jgi:hypothetical protein
MGTLGGSDAFAKGGPWEGVAAYWRANSGIEEMSGHLESIESAPIPLVQGVQGRAFHFDGTRSLNTIYDPAINVSEFTIGFWVRPTVSSDSCCQGLVSAENFLVETKENNLLQVFIVTTGSGGGGVITTQVSGPPSLPANQWTHVVTTYDGQSLRLYVNGTQWGDPVLTSGPVQPNPSNGFLSIGSEDGRASCTSCQGTRYFTGDMDEIAVLNYAMDANEVATMYRSGVLASIGQ